MKNGNELPLERCPHCSVHKPHLVITPSGREQTADSEGMNTRVWVLYRCVSCGGVTLTMSKKFDILEMWPRGEALSEDIPERARDFLRQAMESVHAPSLAQIGTASAVDAMLKAKGYKRGSLHERIEEAKSALLITPEMADWFHEIRLDANEQRHPDENASPPNKDDAERTIKFAKALAEYLFVLPALVTRGRAKTVGAEAKARAGTVRVKVISPRPTAPTMR